MGDLLRQTIEKTNVQHVVYKFYLSVDKDLYIPVRLRLL